MYNVASFFNLFFIAVGIFVFALCRMLWSYTNRNYTENAEDYFNRNYLDYSARLDNIMVNKK